ncbi:LAGLIDADG-like domain protein [uncultured archaeon]|nr:LAGLIDADG-like domain protein [uncultured archaeon]
MGDGSMKRCPRKRGGFHYDIQITSSSDIYLKRFNRIFFLLFGIEGRIYRDVRRDHAYNLIIPNAAVFWYFVSQGMPIGKKGEVDIQDRLRQKERFFHFLKGMIETDGHVCGRRIQLKQKSRKLLLSITDMLSEHGIKVNEPKVNYTNGKPFYYIRFDNIYNMP